MTMRRIVGWGILILAVLIVFVWYPLFKTWGPMIVVWPLGTITPLILWVLAFFAFLKAKKRIDLVVVFLALPIVLYRVALVGLALLLWSANGFGH